MGILLSVEHPRTTGHGTTDEGTIETTFDERAADPMDCNDSQVQSLADLLVRPCRTEATAVGLQQDAGSGQPARPPYLWR